MGGETTMDSGQEVAGEDGWNSSERRGRGKVLERTRDREIERESVE